MNGKTKDMKKHFILFALLAFFSLNALAQQDNRANSNFGLSLEAGFSHLFFGNNLNPLSNYATPSYGGGAGATFFYELQYKHFLFRTGFGVNYSLNINRFESMMYKATIQEYPTMEYQYDFHNSRELTTYGIGYVPVYFGGLFNRFFFLIGAKIGVLPFFGFTQSRADLTLRAIDTDVVDPIENLPTHQLGDYSLKSEVFPMNYNRLNVMGSLELGINLDKAVWSKEKKKLDKAEQYRELHRRKSFKERQHYRLSFFMDFGCWNIFPQNTDNMPSNIYDIQGVDKVVMGSIFSQELPANITVNKFLNNMMFGIKFAVMCEVPHKAPNKGSMANPYIVTYVNDELTGKPLGGAIVRTQTVPKGKGKPRISEKETDAKRGRTMRAYPPGDYIISVSRPGYFPEKPFNFTHRDDYDTLHIALYPHRTLRAEAVDANTGRAIKANLTVMDGQGNKVVSAKLDSLNPMLSTVVDDRRQLSIRVVAEGYKDTTIVVTDVKDVLRLQIEPKVIRRFVLKNLLFATDKTKILASSRPALQQLYLILKNNPDIRIRIVGHTDDVGRDDYNQKLSEGRAKNVKREMVNRGIAPSRIETAGRGKRDPIVKNDSEEHRQMNRRVEIEILDGASVELIKQ